MHTLLFIAAICATGAGLYYALPSVTAVSYSPLASTTPAELAGQVAASTPKPTLDKQDYDRRLLALAHIATSSPFYALFMDGTEEGTTTPLWPVRAAYPKAGALLPFNRIVAYYGNFYSKGMGILGEYDRAEVLSRLRAAVAEWEAADPTTPVVPAIEYIDVTAQELPGKEGKYRLRMPDSQIDKALEYAEEIDGIVILDIQVGLSTVQDEVAMLRDYLIKPNVHLAIDPEFDMEGTDAPGDVIGTTDAATINWAAEYLADLVNEYDLPPKILLLHRFTQKMITGYKHIKPLPEVQIIMQMDGWGSPQRKIGTYNYVVYPEPVQFAGLKIFYKNDLKEDPPRLLTPAEVLKLKPAPIFIQYQ